MPNFLIVCSTTHSLQAAHGCHHRRWLRHLVSSIGRCEAIIIDPGAARSTG
jgi:hypothetical protein